MPQIYIDPQRVLSLSSFLDGSINLLQSAADKLEQKLYMTDQKILDTNGIRSDIYEAIAKANDLMARIRNIKTAVQNAAYAYMEAERKLLAMLQPIEAFQSSIETGLGRLAIENGRETLSKSPNEVLWDSYENTLDFADFLQENDSKAETVSDGVDWMNKGALKGFLDAIGVTAIEDIFGKIAHGSAEFAGDKKYEGFDPFVLGESQPLTQKAKVEYTVGEAVTALGTGITMLFAGGAGTAAKAGEASGTAEALSNAEKAAIDAHTIPQLLIRQGQIPSIGKMRDLNTPSKVVNGEFKVADYLPDMGSPKANWKQNSGILRSVIKEKVPIKDVSDFPMDNAGFLGAERNLLQSRGWVYKNGYWYPPIK